MALHFLGAVSLGLTASTLGMICATAGIVLALGGLPWLRALAFPLFLLVFLLPKPELVWSRVTLPAQLFASQLAAAIADLVGTHVVRDGNVLTVSGHSIAVAEACNGLRYVLSLTFVSLVWAHVSGLRGWRRILMAAAAFPVSILVNALRVAAVAIMCRYNFSFAVGSFHEASGWIALALAVMLLLVVEQALRPQCKVIERKQTPRAPSAAFHPAWSIALSLIFVAQILPVQAAPC